MPSLVIIRKSMPSPLIESLLTADFIDRVTRSLASCAVHVFFVALFNNANR